ncbi:hypothetical protein [Streptomyces sp. CC210A]|uniref:hypothetical protein n=1 Tax=Streptomyces sp. CC210A TaxID=2898184 RepID=UPI001F19FC43|nr:hypothetical protein [Streptomyces sp. CC210A]
MGLFSRKPKNDTPEDVLVTGSELRSAARALNRGDQKPADALVERAGSDPALRRMIAMRVLGASIDEQ